MMAATALRESDPVLEEARAIILRIRKDRVRARLRMAGVVLLLVTAMAVALSAEILVGGTADIPHDEILPALAGEGSALADFVIVQTRLPRGLTALLVGALFGLSGSLYQRLFSNVLATPDIIGVSAGASAGAVAVIIGAGAGGIAVQGGAIAGALLAAALIFGLSWSRRSATYRLILIGIGIGACFTALTSYLLTIADSMASTRAVRWMIGSLSGAEWSDVGTLAITFAVGLTGAALLAPALSTIGFGDSLAAALGTRVRTTRVLTLLSGAALAAVAASVAGPIAFIALVSGPIAARILLGAGPLPAALVGATLLAAADFAAQTAPLISPVPTGVLTGVIGAPILIILLLTRKADA